MSTYHTNIRVGASVYLPSHLTQRFNPMARGYVTRVFTAPAVMNPFNLSSAPLRADTPCVEISFLQPRVTVIADLTSGDLVSVAQGVSGKTVTVYVGVQAPENGSGAALPKQKELSAEEVVVQAYRDSFPQENSEAKATADVVEGMMTGTPLILGEGPLT